MVNRAKELIDNLGLKKFPGSNVAKGKSYHSFPGYEGSSHIGSVADRIKLITNNYNVNNKLGVDLGCNCGGISIELAKLGARMTGVDYDYQSIDVAKHYSHNLNASFFTQNIDIEYVKKIECDFVVYFSAWMWAAKQYGIDIALDMLFEIGKKVPVMFFENSCGDGMAGDVMRANGINEVRMVQILGHCYKNVKKIGIHESWRKRPIFMCEGRLPFEYKGYQNNKIERIGYDTVLKNQPRNQHLNECVGLSQFKNQHFPTLHSFDDNTIYISYCGEQLKRLPANWKDQAEEILQALRESNIVHRDIIPRNLLIKDGIIKLIDFSWSGPPDEDISKFPGRLGTDFRKYPGFDDRYSLYKSLEWIGEHEV